MRTKDKTLKVALSLSTCIGYVDLYKEIFLSVHRKACSQNPIRFCLTDILLNVRFCLQGQELPYLQK